MIITSLPNSNRFEAGSPAPTENTVIIADTHDKYFYPEHRTPYLFVTNDLNRGRYLVNRRPIEVSARQFYFLNANDTIEINFKRDRLKTCLILFREGFVEECSQYLTCSEEELLDSPDLQPSTGARFPERPGTMRFPNLPLELSSVIQRTLSQIHRKEDLDNTLFELIFESHRLSGQASQSLKRISATKRTTKEELYRRLAQAREFMQDNISRNLTIEEIAGEVCLNKFHFLSNFKDVFNTTPHRYFTELKLQKALALLQTRQHSVMEVCFLVGFESPGSFSNLFKKRFKTSPSKIPNFR